MNRSTLQTQKLDISTVKAFEHQLDDVMEMIDKEKLKTKLSEVERVTRSFQANGCL